MKFNAFRKSPPSQPDSSDSPRFASVADRCPADCEYRTSSDRCRVYTHPEIMWNADKAGGVLCQTPPEL